MDRSSPMRACGQNRQTRISPSPSLHSSFESWPSQNPFHHWCIPVIKKHQCLSAAQTGTLRHSQVTYYAPNPTCPPLHFPSSIPVPPVSEYLFFPSSMFAVMDERWTSLWQACSWCHIITVSPFRQNYQIIPTPPEASVRLTGPANKRNTNILEWRRKKRGREEEKSRKLQLPINRTFWWFWWLLGNYVQ